MQAYCGWNFYCYTSNWTRLTLVSLKFELRVRFDAALVLGVGDTSVDEEEVNAVGVCSLHCLSRSLRDIGRICQRQPSAMQGKHLRPRACSICAPCQVCTCIMNTALRVEAKLV